MSKPIENSYPIWREAKVINITDPEKLGRIQLKVYPELVDIPDDDCPWCFPHNGGVHGKSFGLPLVDQLISCVVWNRFWNEITFLPFSITKPTEHLFDKWKSDQRPAVADMETDPEEEHLVVDQFEDDFSIFHDTKNNQHGFLHPTGTYGVINKDGSVFFQSVKKYTFHNKDSDLFLETDSDTGDITFKTKGKVEKTVKGNVEVTGESDLRVTIKGNTKVETTGNTEIRTVGNTKIESTGKMDIKSSGPCTVESLAMTTVKGSSMVIIDAPILKFSGSKSMGQVVPSGSGVCCALAICPCTGLPQTG